MDECHSTTTKICNHCKECKLTSAFNKKVGGRHGVRAICKQCQYEYDKQWHKNQADLSQAQAKQRHESRRRYELKRNARGRRAERQVFYAANKDRLNATTLAFAKRNPQVYAARAMRRIAIKKQATPSWSETKEIDCLYAQAAKLCSETGIKWHVDHIVPLNSSIVCGLHVMANLRVITATENLSKGNSYWPDMP